MVTDALAHVVFLCEMEHRRLHPKTQSKQKIAEATAGRTGLGQASRGDLVELGVPTRVCLCWHVYMCVVCKSVCV